jgi:hypothetical protein
MALAHVLGRQDARFAGGGFRDIGGLCPTDRAQPEWAGGNDHEKREPSDDPAAIEHG